MASTNFDVDSDNIIQATRLKSVQLMENLAIALNC